MLWWIIIAIFIIWGLVSNYRDNKEAARRAEIERIKQKEEAKRQAKLKKVAQEILEGFDFEKEEKEIKSIFNKVVPKEKKCPHCGGLKVLRVGRYGKFWGCIRYPNCHFTSQYTE